MYGFFRLALMTIEIGDTSFADLMDKLCKQVELTKARCKTAEAEANLLRDKLAEKQFRIEELEKQNQELSQKYQGLQAGTANGASPEEIATLRDRYLAMIREIDLCLSRLNG